MSPNVYSAYEVFTPTTQAKLNFVPRDSVNDQLVDAIRTPGKQLIVYGESGSGKSSLLLKKLEELYSDHITTRCSGASTEQSLVLDAFDQLAPYYESAVKETEYRGRSLTMAFRTIQGQIQRSQTTESEQARALPPQLTPQRLAEFLGAQGMCWVVEDFHKVSEPEKRFFGQMMKVFSDTATEFPSVKMVAIGATATARQVVQYEPEMNNRVAEIYVPLMDADELTAILDNGSVLLNVDMNEYRAQIVEYAVGMASVCHQLALNACLSADIGSTQPDVAKLEHDDLEAAIKRYIAESSDSLVATFELALRRRRLKKFDNCRLILAALASGPLSGLRHGEILARIRDIHPAYPAGNLTNYLRQLMTDDRGAVLGVSGDGGYRFVDPLHHAYARLSLVAVAEPPERAGSIYGSIAARSLYDLTLQYMTEMTPLPTGNAVELAPGAVWHTSISDEYREADLWPAFRERLRGDVNGDADTSDG